MKKTIVSMMMAVALIAGGSAYAQTPDGNTGATVKTENCDNCPAGKGSKGEKAGKGKKGHKAGKPKFNPFEGIQLTPDQQQRLQVLQQGLGPVKLTKAEKAKIKENPNLTPEQKAQLKAERKAKKKEAKKNYLAGVKETLTPDQYVIFLENCYLYTPSMNKSKAVKPGKKGPRGDKHGEGRKDKANK